MRCAHASLRVFVLTSLLGMVAPIRLARASSADELVSMGKSRESVGDVNVALKDYMSALRIDPTHEGAYLALGALRERTGDANEAERTYAVAIEHIPTATAPFLALARLWWRTGREEDGSTLLWRLAEARAPEVLQDLAAHFEQRAESLRALATWRRLASLARIRDNAPLAVLAEENAHAIVQFVRELDPVTRPTRPTLARSILIQVSAKAAAHVSPQKTP